LFLPDGQRFLYTIDGISTEQNGVYLSSLDGRENRRVLAGRLQGTFCLWPTVVHPGKHPDGSVVRHRERES
jgi:hypothetical protein